MGSGGLFPLAALPGEVLPGPEHGGSRCRRGSGHERRAGRAPRLSCPLGGGASAELAQRVRGTLRRGPRCRRCVVLALGALGDPRGGGRAQRGVRRAHPLPVGRRGAGQPGLGAVPGAAGYPRGGDVGAVPTGPGGQGVPLGCAGGRVGRRREHPRDHLAGDRRPADLAAPGGPVGLGGRGRVRRWPWWPGRSPAGFQGVAPARARRARSVCCPRTSPSRTRPGSRGSAPPCTGGAP